MRKGDEYTARERCSREARQPVWGASSSGQAHSAPTLPHVFVAGQRLKASDGARPYSTKYTGNSKFGASCR